MAFYRISEESNMEVIGSSSGLQAHISGPEIEASAYFANGKCEFPPRPGTKFDIFRLNEESLVTDVISVGSNICLGLLANRKAMRIIQMHNLPSYSIYESKILGNGCELDYELLFLTEDSSSMIDFKRSKFLVQKSMFSKNYEPLEIFNYEDLKAAYRKVVGIKKIIPDGNLVIDSKLQSLDMFRIGSFERARFVSERLMNALIENQITGLRFTRVNHFD